MEPADVSYGQAATTMPRFDNQPFTEPRQETQHSHNTTENAPKRRKLSSHEMGSTPRIALVPISPAPAPPPPPQPPQLGSLQIAPIKTVENHGIGQYTAKSKEYFGRKRPSVLNLRNYPSDHHPVGIAIWVVQKVEQMRREMVEHARAEGTDFPTMAILAYPRSAPEQRVSAPATPIPPSQWTLRPDGGFSVAQATEEQDAARLQAQRNRKTKQRSENWAKNKENDVVARAKLEAKKKFGPDISAEERQQWVQARFKEDYARLLNRLATQLNSEIVHLPPFKINWADHFFYEPRSGSPIDHATCVAGRLLARVLPALAESQVSARHQYDADALINGIESGYPMVDIFQNAIRSLAGHPDVLQGVDRILGSLFTAKSGPFFVRKRASTSSDSNGHASPYAATPSGTPVWHWKEPATLARFASPSASFTAAAPREGLSPSGEYLQTLSPISAVTVYAEYFQPPLPPIYSQPQPHPPNTTITPPFARQNQQQAPSPWAAHHSGYTQPVEALSGAPAPPSLPALNTTYQTNTSQQPPALTWSANMPQATQVDGPAKEDSPKAVPATPVTGEQRVPPTGLADISRDAQMDGPTKAISPNASPAISVTGEQPQSPTWSTNLSQAIQLDQPMKEDSPKRVTATSTTRDIAGDHESVFTDDNTAAVNETSPTSIANAITTYDEASPAPDTPLTQTRGRHVAAPRETMADLPEPMLRSSGRERKPTAKALAAKDKRASRKRSVSPTAQQTLPKKAKTSNAVPKRPSRLRLTFTANDRAETTSVNGSGDSDETLSPNQETSTSSVDRSELPIASPTVGQKQKEPPMFNVKALLLSQPVKMSEADTAGLNLLRLAGVACEWPDSESDDDEGDENDSEREDRFQRRLAEVQKKIMQMGGPSGLGPINVSPQPQLPGERTHTVDKPEALQQVFLPKANTIIPAKESKHYSDTLSRLHAEDPTLTRHQVLEIGSTSPLTSPRPTSHVDEDAGMANGALMRNSDTMHDSLKAAGKRRRQQSSDDASADERDDHTLSVTSTKYAQTWRRAATTQQESAAPPQSGYALPAYQYSLPSTSTSPSMSTNTDAQLNGFSSSGFRAVNRSYQDYNPEASRTPSPMSAASSSTKTNGKTTVPRGSQFAFHPRGLNGGPPGGGTIINASERRQSQARQRRQTPKGADFTMTLNGTKKGNSTPAPPQITFKKGGELISFGQN